MGSSDLLLAIDHVSIRAGTRTIITGGGLTLRRGDAVALLGASGSGKTLTASAILGLADVVAPGVTIELNIRWPYRPAEELRMAYVPQGTAGHLHPYLPVRRQLQELTTGANRSKTAHPTEADFRNTLTALRFDAPGQILDAYPHELSGGMRQRILIAVALLSDPDLVVLDEPTSALDGMARAAVYSKLQLLRQTRGSSLLVVTHDPVEADILANKTYLIHRERIDEIERPTLAKSQISIEQTAVIPTAAARDSSENLNSQCPSDRTKRSSLPVVLRADRLSVRPNNTGLFPAGRNFELRDFSCTVRRGEVLAIVGETGCGKTTCIRGLALLAQVTGGTIHLGEVIINQSRGRALRDQRQLFQVMFQDSHLGLNPFISIYDLFREPALLHGHSSPLPVHIIEALRAAGLSNDVLPRKVHELSHGQKQRIALCRLLVGFPDLELLLLDEPLTGLDSQSKSQMIAMLRSFKIRGGAIVLASHDLRLVDEICDDVAILKQGLVVEMMYGPDRQLRTQYGREFWNAFHLLG